MKKFAANYLINFTGQFLKNGIVCADENGNVTGYTDTQGNLRETELLEFHNGILLGAVSFLKSDQTGKAIDPCIPEYFEQFLPHSPVIDTAQFIEILKQFQSKFPEKQVPEIFTETMHLLQLAEFEKKPEPGIYLISGVNLPELKLKPKSRVKRLI